MTGPITAWIDGRIAAAIDAAFTPERIEALGAALATAVIGNLGTLGADIAARVSASLGGLIPTSENVAQEVIDALNTKLDPAALAAAVAAAIKGLLPPIFGSGKL